MVPGHWWALARPSAVVACLLAGGVAAAVRHAPGWAADAVAVALLVATAWLLGRWLRWRAASATLTSRRLVRRSGVLVVRRREVRLDAVVEVSTRQRPWQRVLRAGDVVVGGAGGREVLAWVPAPASLARDLRRAVDAARAERGPSVAGELAELDGLRRRGVLTEGEFELSKARLLR